MKYEKIAQDAYGKSAILICGFTNRGGFHVLIDLGDESADKLAGERQDSGETPESMLGTLREVRAEYDAKENE